jgi:sulfotransferase
MKTLHFIAGLPRSGSTLLANVLRQNPDIHGEAVSSLSSLVGTVHSNWQNIEQNQEYDNPQAHRGVLMGIIEGYYRHIDRPIIIDKDRGWTFLIPVMESLLERKVKIIVAVRNPAEILASFEKLRRQNPMFMTRADSQLGPSSSIASRAYFYSGPDGPLGLSHRCVQDAVTMGHLDRMLFVDYNRYCSNPKSQTKRIYDFLELPYFDHDFENLQQPEKFNDQAVGLPNLHRIKPSLQKTTVNPVEYLGLDLYEQYNQNIFWNAWI